jgi:hypothetical protein
MQSPPLRYLCPGVFETAASHLLTGHADTCCHAIARALYGPNYPILDDKEPHTLALLDLFAPVPGELLQLQPAYYWGGGDQLECRNARIIALLTLAAMVRDAKSSKRVRAPALH